MHQRVFNLGSFKCPKLGIVSLLSTGLINFVLINNLEKQKYLKFDLW